MFDIFTQINFEYLFKIVLTILIVGPIGFEREIKHKSAGLITHLLVALGTLSIGILQLELTLLNPLDNQRLIAQAITGVGFLGAGAIMKTNENIQGLTTASSLWVVAMLGIIIGMGYYELAIMIGISAFCLLTFIRKYYYWTMDKLKDNPKSNKKHR